MQNMMSGPDMLHLVDEHDKIRVNVWQPVRIPSTVEIVLYDKAEKQVAHSLERIRPDTDMVALIRRHLKVVDAREWTAAPGARHEPQCFLG